MAAEQLLEKHSKADLIERINKAVASAESAPDAQARRVMTGAFRRLVEGTW